VLEAFACRNWWSWESLPLVDAASAAGMVLLDVMPDCAGAAGDRAADRHGRWLPHSAWRR